MNNMELLTTALEFLEEHLTEKVTTEDVAKACYCSKSTLEKLFRCVNNISVHDYIIRRRLTKAAEALLKNPGISILDVALEYGYNSNEAFTRAFKQAWNCKPSEFRNQTHYCDQFPALWMGMVHGEQSMKKIDISELYDLIKARRSCYCVCCDIKQLIPINEISRTAGDLALAEALHRMEEAGGEEDISFRIGNDEFVMMTASEDITYAEKIAAKISGCNGNTFPYEDKNIPLSLYVGLIKLDADTGIRYYELFPKVKDVIDGLKEQEE